VATYDGKRTRAGLRHDKHSRSIYPNGDVYWGEYRDTYRTGDGFYLFKGGTTFAGTLADGSFHVGTLRHPDGSVYVGQHKGCLPEGQVSDSASPSRVCLSLGNTACSAFPHEARSCTHITPYVAQLLACTRRLTDAWGGYSYTGRVHVPQRGEVFGGLGRGQEARRWCILLHGWLGAAWRLAGKPTAFYTDP
jgi:hypothetical protein